MTNRRQFIRTGLAASAATLTLPQTFAGQSIDTARPSMPIELFIYDDRFADAVAAANAATVRSVPVASATRVMTDLWYDELDLRWRQKPMTLAGMTTGRGLFVFETLALDRNMRVVERKSIGGGLLSWTIAPRDLLPAA